MVSFDSGRSNDGVCQSSFRHGRTGILEVYSGMNTQCPSFPRMSSPRAKIGGVSLIHNTAPTHRVLTFVQQV